VLFVRPFRRQRCDSPILPLVIHLISVPPGWQRRFNPGSLLQDVFHHPPLTEDDVIGILVEAFRNHLEKERKSSPRTRNHRLAILHAFFRYVQAEEPAHMLQCQKILAIPLRRHARPTVAYLSKEELAEILAQPNVQISQGRRDAVLLSVLYDTGARVQELIDLSVGDVRLDPPAQLRLMGRVARCGPCP